MSASLVRKALDETTFASDEKLDQLSKSSNKKTFKPLKKKKKLNKDKVLKQNLKILKSLECKLRPKTTKSDPPASSNSAGLLLGAASEVKSKKAKKNKKEVVESGFTDEDFEKFEKEYFVTH